MRIFILACLVASSALAASSAPKKKVVLPLGTRIENILASAPEAAWGIRIVDLRTGAAVYSKNELQPFVPASNAKLFSTALALTRLGPDYRFRTVITAPGKPDATGRVSELRFVGGGDPNLSGRPVPYEYEGATANPLRHVEQFAQQLVDSGLKWVDGDVVGDDSAYAPEPFPEGWAVDDPVYDYGAPVSALFLSDSTFTLRLYPTTKDAPLYVEASPAVTSMLIHNRALTGASNDIHFARLPGSNEFTITGTIQKEEVYRMALDNPPLFAAEALRESLLKRGVRVSGMARAEHSPAPGVELVGYESPRLIEALKIINKDSMNLHAEVVLLETCRVRTGVATRKYAIDELRTFLTEIGIDTKHYTFEDASGLSRKTLITPTAVTRLLMYMYNSPHREIWVDTLPIGGEDGTLAKRFGANIQARQIRAKTGSLSHVNALAGYAANRYAFSILVNNANASSFVVRKAIDRIVLTLLQ